MARVDKVAQELAEISQLGRDVPTPTAIARLREVLRGKQPLVITPAARLIGRWGAREAIPELIGAFERFVIAPDPGAAAKTAVAEALVGMVVTEAADVFERGVTIFQSEGGWGGSVDVAAGLRGWCALGLAAIGHRNQVRLILPLLADTEAQARLDAVRALAQGGSDAAEALLRLKALQGDPEEAVTGECLAALGQAWPERSVDFLVKLIDSPPPIDRLAMQALGESRCDAGWQKLVALYDADLSPTRRRQIIGALAYSRRGAAVEWLLSVIEDAGAGEAAIVVEAMAIRRNEPALWARVETLARARGKPIVDEALARALRS